MAASGKASFLKETVENADLLKTILKKTMTTQQQCVEYDFVAPLNLNYLYLFLTKLKIKNEPTFVVGELTLNFPGYRINIVKVKECVNLFQNNHKLLILKPTRMTGSMS